MFEEIERSVEITIAQGRQVKNIDRLEIGREYLEDSEEMSYFDKTNLT